MTDSSDTDREDGQVDADAENRPAGYGNPPRHTRWKKGQSGNPAGRPKNARGLRTDLRAELVSRMDIRMNGQVVSGTRQQLMLRTLSARAASGDIRATRILIDLVMQVFGPEDHGGGEKRLSAQDQQILDALLARKGSAPLSSADNDAGAELNCSDGSADADTPDAPAVTPTNQDDPPQETPASKENDDDQPAS